MRSSRNKLQPAAPQPAVRATNARPEVIRTQVADKISTTPRQKKREAAAINPTVKKRVKNKVTAAEAAYRRRLKSLQDELKSVKTELRAVSREERQLAREVEKIEIALKMLTEKEASLK